MQTFYTLWAKYLNTFTRFGLKCMLWRQYDVIGLRIWFYAEFDTLFSLIHALDAQKITFSLYCKKIYKKEGDLNNWTDTLSYLSRLHCIFYNSDDSNETLWLKNKNKLLWFCLKLFAGQLYFGPEFDFRLVPPLRRYCEKVGLLEFLCTLGRVFPILWFSHCLKPRTDDQVFLGSSPSSCVQWTSFLPTTFLDKF